MSHLNPKPKDHPLIVNGIMSGLYNKLIECKKCPRIVGFREKIAKEKRKQYLDWNYWGKPIPGYGDINARILLVGLAPAAHGGNRTARVFTGDKSADFLIDSLYEAGLTNQPYSTSLDDGLIMNDIFMTPILKCVPPQDKPKAEELNNCSNYFQTELKFLKNIKIILALGKIGFDGCLKYFQTKYDIKKKDFPFGHNVNYNMPDKKILWGCYHPSPRNVNTGRMNKDMMLHVLNRIKKKL